jgi:endonuclease/exonuclease/phosphatase family metal-dependent hydrolase
MITVATFKCPPWPPAQDLTNNGLLASAVAGLGADVVGLQEVERHVVRSWFRHQPAAIARAAGMNYVYAPARRFAVTGDDGIALLVRGEILRFSSVMLPRQSRRSTHRDRRSAADGGATGIGPVAPRRRSGGQTQVVDPGPEIGR